MTFNRNITIQGGWLEKLYEVQKQSEKDVIDEGIKRGNDLRLFRNANLFQTIIATIKDSSTAWEPLDFAENDGIVDAIYKDWEIQIVSTEEAGLEDLATIIIPYITYNVIYETPNPNDVDYYNSEFNLKTTSMFEVKGNILFLRISVYMEKYWESPDLLIPMAKVLVTFKNPFEVLK